MKTKQKHFYSHLLPLEEIVIELNATEMSDDEKTHLITIVEQQMHYTVIDVVLTTLPDHKKQLFLKHLHRSDHSTIWQFFGDKTLDIEYKIKQATKQLKEELLSDIHEVKHLSKKTS